MSSTYTIGMASNLDSFADAPAKDGAPPELYFYFVFVSYDDNVKGPPTFVVTEQSTHKAKRPAKGPLPAAVAHTTKPLFGDQVAADGPKAAIVLQAKPTPGALVRVEVTVPGVASSRPPDDFDFAPRLNAGATTMVLRRDEPPRLSRAINTTFVAKPASGNFASPGAADIKAILAHIESRLLDGPAAAWRGSDGTPQLPFTPYAIDDAEEEWAKRITEMLISAPYGLPSTLYSAGSVQFSDESVLVKYLDDNDPGYPLCFECQHLVTMASMTRGIYKPLPPPKNPPKGPLPDKKTTDKMRLPMFTAGDGSAGTVTDLGGTFLTSINTVGAAIDAKITPGSSWVYNGYNKDHVEMGNQGAAHIGFAVRVDEKGRRIQTFDTGGLNVVGRDTPLNARTFDDPWVTETQQVPGSGGPYKGVCKMPPAPDLGKALERMRLARPLGFARLVLTKRGAVAPGATDILWASALLRMHHDSPNAPIQMSYGAYLWSLRDHPGAAHITATWLFYTPQGALARAMLDGDPKDKGSSPRSFTIARLLQIAGNQTAATAQLNAIYGTSDLESQADGTVRVTYRFDQHPPDPTKPPQPKRPGAFAPLPWGARSGSVKLGDADLADLPYLRG